MKIINFNITIDNKIFVYIIPKKKIFINII